MAALMVFSFWSFAAAAEDNEPVSEPATEPVETFTTYDICEDPDFLVLQYMAKGNDKATILHPGDKITTYKNSNIDVLYYPDADGMYNGEWEPADPSNLAFSLSAAESFKETFPKKVGEATIRGLGDETSDGVIDFTIAYSEKNTFVGWVVYDYEAAKNTIKLCAVWEKTQTSEDARVCEWFHSASGLNSSASEMSKSPAREMICSSVSLSQKEFRDYINNAFLALETYLYNLFFNKEPAA